MDKGAVFIVKCLQAFCIVVAAVIGIFQIVQVTADPLDQLVREDRIKVRTDVCMIAPRILQEQLFLYYRFRSRLQFRIQGCMGHYSFGFY